MSLPSHQAPFLIGKRRVSQPSPVKREAKEGPGRAWARRSWARNTDPKVPCRGPAPVPLRPDRSFRSPPQGSRLLTTAVGPSGHPPPTSRVPVDWSLPGGRGRSGGPYGSARGTGPRPSRRCLTAQGPWGEVWGPGEGDSAGGGGACPSLGYGVPSTNMPE